MIRTHPVEFDSVEHRNGVHDAVEGRGKALTDDEAELRALFDVGQTFAYVEKNEPYRGALLSLPFTFEDEAAYHRAVEVLSGQSDADLDWLGKRLDEAGIDDEFEESDLPGGVGSAFES